MSTTPTTQAGKAMFAEHLNSVGEPCTCEFAARIAKAEDQARDSALSLQGALNVLGDHEGMGCCDPKTLEHVADSVRELAQRTGKP